MNIDFGSTADDYVKYRLGFPDAFLVRLFAEAYAKASTGTLARGLAFSTPRICSDGNIAMKLNLYCSCEIASMGVKYN